MSKRGSCAHERRRRASPPPEAHHRGRYRVSRSKTHKPWFIPFETVICRLLRNAFLARDNRDITVPTGMERVSAISWYDISSRSHRRRISRKWTGNSSIARCSSSRFERSTRSVSGVLPSTGNSGGSSSSESRDRVIFAFNLVRDVKNVFRKIRYIHARKLVPKRNEGKPFKALA